MTELEIAEVKNAITNVGLSFTKYPKKLEIRIPRAKYPGVYFSIPTDLKSFKIQILFHHTSFAHFEKIKTKGYNVVLEDLTRSIFLNEIKGIPAQEEIEGYLSEALETVKTLGIVNTSQVN